MKLYQYLLFFGIMIMLGSCALLRNNCDIDKFTLVKEPLYGSSSNYTGIYVDTVMGMGLLIDSMGYLRILHKMYSDTSTVHLDSGRASLKDEFWGACQINQDTIKIQWFNYHKHDACRRWLWEMNGVISEDQIYSLTLSSYGRHTDFQKEYAFVFRKISNVAPSIAFQAWFADQNWFNKSVHPSRSSERFR